MASPRPSRPCPCRAGDSGRAALDYLACCGRFHGGPLQPIAVPAPDAESLMRSRYSAFVLDLPHYLLASWHASTRPAAIDAPEPGLQWLGLQIRRHVPQGADHALVEFVARSKLGGRAHRLHETSRFVREDGRWFYVDGQLR